MTRALHWMTLHLLVLSSPLLAFAQQPPDGTPPAAETAPTAQGSVTADAAIETPTTSASPGLLTVGLELGGIFPQPFTGLGTHIALGVEAGLILPVAAHRLEVFFSSAYAPPIHSFSDGPYEAEILQQELTFSLGPRFRFLATTSKVNVSAAAGPRLFLLRSLSNGSSEGEDFAEFREQSTQIGFFLALGGELRAGPGALLLDLDFGYSSLPHEISGDTSTANLTGTLGYRLFLL